MNKHFSDVFPNRYIAYVLLLKFIFERRIYVGYYSAEQYVYQNILLFYKVSYDWCI